jgi:hypothetical protein
MSAFPALALAIALTYVIGDAYRPLLPRALSFLLDMGLVLILFLISNRYLKNLKE